MGTSAKKSTTRSSEKTHPNNGVGPVKNGAEKPVWEIVAEIGSEVPDEEWAGVPDDGSINYRHYRQVARENRQ
jgi:hypothetical protein